MLKVSGIEINILAVSEGLNRICIQSRLMVKIEAKDFCSQKSKKKVMTVI